MSEKLPEEEKVRAAGVRKAERLLGKDTAEIVRATRESREIRSTHRVYAKQWLLESRHATEEQAAAAGQAKYGGRLYEDDVRTVAPSKFTSLWTLYVHRWNVAGEWKEPDAAERHAEALMEAGSEVQIVTRNSRSEHALTSYGVLKLVGR